jgi:hypothetical protein
MLPRGVLKTLSTNVLVLMIVVIVVQFHHEGC